MRLRASGRRRFSGWHNIADIPLEERGRVSATFPSNTNNANLEIKENGKIVVRCAKDSISLSGAYDLEIELDRADIAKLFRLSSGSLSFNEAMKLLIGPSPG
jgi:hypothetical protein